MIMMMNKMNNNIKTTKKKHIKKKENMKKRKNMKMKIKIIGEGMKKRQIANIPGFSGTFLFVQNLGRFLMQ